MAETINKRRNRQYILILQQCALALKTNHSSTCVKDVSQLTTNDYKSVEDLQWLKYTHDYFFIAGHFSSVVCKGCYIHLYA